ncbi:MAG: SDR family oxidoreductase [Verrucomicrobiota bacterium]
MISNITSSAARKLSGKVALVTGGSRGIGAAIARRLAADGADVVISYANSAEKAQAVVRELEAEGVRATAIQADQGDAAQVATLVKTVAARFGRLDILVNSAGVFVIGGVSDSVEDAARFERQFAVNVGGVAAAVRAASTLIAPGGRIITIGSGAAERSPWPGVADYSATKAAVAGYTRGWARDFGPKGVTVNLVQPGHTDTEMNPASSEMAQSEKNFVALGRYGRPEEIAAAVAFLAGPDASYITGATLNVDGGYNA